MTHKHTFVPGKSGTVAICSCGKFQHINVKPEDVITEIPATTYEVHEGRPSWHQQRAGHISAGVTTGFKTREDAEAFAAKLKAHHPNMPVFVREVK